MCVKEYFISCCCYFLSSSLADRFRKRANDAKRSVANAFVTEKTEGDSKEMCVTARAYICICGAAQFGAAGAYTCNAFFMQLDRKH